MSRNPNPPVEDPLSGFSSLSPGVTGKSASQAGVYGLSEHTVVMGEVIPADGFPAPNDGVLGEGKNGVHGISRSANDAGVLGENTSEGFGVRGTSASPYGTGLSGANTSNGNGIQASSVGGDALYAFAGGSGNGILVESSQGTALVARAGTVGKLAAQFWGNIEHHGDMSCTGDISLTNQECAEDFDVEPDATAEPGTVMVLSERGEVCPSYRPYDKKVAGVISGAGNFKAALVLGRHDSCALHRAPIALMGKVYCKVDATFGRIEVGDLLTTSPTPGHAMKATNREESFGSVIGKALRNLENGRDLIPVLIALQ